MATIVTTVNKVKTEHEIELNPSGINVLVHDQGVRVDVPSFVEINPADTINCMRKMTEKEWRWVSTGQLFRHLFKLSFSPDHRGNPPPEIPDTIEELNAGDMGVAHIAGMITLGCEACFAKKNIFIRNPETYLHPATERHIMEMFREMLKLLGQRGTVTTATEPQGGKPEDKKEEEPVPPEMLEEPRDPKEVVLKWLDCMEPEKDLCRVGDRTYKVREMIEEVKAGTEVGIGLSRIFFEKRDNP